MQPQRIIFDGHSGIGDTMQYIAALLSLRAMYPQAQILFTTNTIGKMLLGSCNFVDRIAVVWQKEGSADSANLQRLVQQAKYFTVAADALDDEINGLHLPSADMIVCVERNKELLEAALSTGAQVFTFSTLRALTHKNLHFSLPFNRHHMHEMVRYQHLVQACDSQLFRKTFSQIDLSQVRLTPLQHDLELIDSFLQQALREAAVAMGTPAHSFQHLVTINPLSKTAEIEGLNFKHADYVALGEHLARKYPQCLFVLSSYGEQDFHQNFQQSASQVPNLKLFVNTGNILTLLALVHRSSLVIAPSTGTAHLADNQSVDLCGIYTKQGSYRWGAGGLQQLCELQAKMRGTAAPVFNTCAYILVKQGWEQEYEHYRDQFFTMCTDFVANHTLKHKPKLPQLVATS